MPGQDLVKKRKAPVWRHCLIPTGITFSQLALILEEITESEQSAAYEFEFYQARVHLREWEEGTTGRITFRYGYMCSSDIFIDSLIKKEEWFTFRPGDGRQYRVEIEERLADPIPFPSVLKQKGEPEVCGWSDRETVNQRLEQYDPIHYGKPDYRSFAELKKEREEGGKGLTGARRPKDRTDRTKLSASAQLKNFAHMLNDNYLQKMAGNILAQLGDGEEINAKDPRSLQDLMEDAAWQMNVDIRKSMGLRPADKEESRNPRVKDLLLEETKENLLGMAAAKENGFYPDRKEMENLEKLCPNIPDEWNPCILQDGKVICKEILREKLYLKVEELQEKKKFYIPDPDEIVEYTENGYPVSDSNYHRLKLFLLEKTNIAMDEIEDYMALIWSHISMGQSLSDILDMFEEECIQFLSDDALQEFAPLMMDVNNNTRMLIHRGWTPLEMFKMLRQTPQPKGQKPKLVPMSSSAAKMLDEASDELKGMGFDVAPNDPCPCGSGKKYKKCCGRK